MKQKKSKQIQQINSSSFDYLEEDIYAFEEDMEELCCPNIADEFYINATNILAEFDAECRVIIGEDIGDVQNRKK